MGTMSPNQRTIEGEIILFDYRMRLYSIEGNKLYQIRLLRALKLLKPPQRVRKLLLQRLKTNVAPSAAPRKTDAKKGGSDNTVTKPKTAPAQTKTQKKADDGKTPAANTNTNKNVPKTKEA